MLVRLQLHLRERKRERGQLRQRRRDRPARLPGQHHPRPGPHRREERLLQPAARLGRHPEDNGLFLRNAGDDRALGWPARCRVRGANPAINAWQKSGGTAIKIVSGAATGGASVIVKSGITSAAQLKGQSVATPSLGNTQDVAVRYWLKQKGLATSITGGGDVSVKPTSPNSAAVLEFQSGQIAGASDAAPYDVEMVKDGGTVLYSEPGVTTVLVVTQSFLSAHPAIVADLVKAQVQANDFIKSSPAAAQTDANAELPLTPASH